MSESWEACTNGSCYRNNRCMHAPCVSAIALKHPAWERYHQADRLWHDLIAASARAHRLMKDAEDKLEKAGEIVRDHR